MLYKLLFEVLAKSEGLGFFRVFGYVSTRIIAAAITSLLISFLLGQWFIDRMRNRQIGQQIREDGPDHQQKQGTPTMGGSLILFSLVTSALLWCDLANEYLWVALTITVGYGAVGFVDDYMKVAKKNTKGVPGKIRLLLEYLIAGGALAYFYFGGVIPEQIQFALQVPFVAFDASWQLPAWLYLPFATTVIVGCANAVNLTDGLDGLAIGPIIFNSSTFLIFSYVAGSAATLMILNQGDAGITLAQYLKVAYLPGADELAILCAGMVGAGIGFLWFNTYPATVFMGDVGSLSLGGAIGALAVLTKNELTLLIVGGLFVAEAMSSIIQVGYFKWSGGKRVFLMAPIHHHYEKKGWAEPKIIVRFWIVSMLLALFALATLKLR